MRRLAGFLLLAVALAGCGAQDVCGRLGSSPSCDGTTTGKCSTALSNAKSQEPSCEPQLSALAACIAELELSCTSATGIAAVGDGMVGGGQNFTDVDGFSVVVNDSKCDVHRRGLEACRTCPDAVGAKTPDVLGVGDRCSTLTPCASGLACQGGICTKSCTDDDDCKARADGCRLQYQYGNVCAQGKCTRSCGSDSACQVWVGSSSTCVSQACSL